MELWDVYNKEGNKIGLKTERGEPLPKDGYHLCVELWVLNSIGELMIQKRSATRRVLPNVWAMTTGCVIAGEDGISGCIREAGEELGMKIQENELHFVRKIVRADTIWEIYMVAKEVDLSKVVLQKEEVSQVIWASQQKIAKMLEDGSIYHYPELEDVMEQVIKMPLPI